MHSLPWTFSSISHANVLFRGSFQPLAARRCGQRPGLRGDRDALGGADAQALDAARAAGARGLAEEAERGCARLGWTKTTRTPRHDLQLGDLGKAKQNCLGAESHMCARPAPPVRLARERHSEAPSSADESKGGGEGDESA